MEVLVALCAICGIILFVGMVVFLPEVIEDRKKHRGDATILNELVATLSVEELAECVVDGKLDSHKVDAAARSKIYASIKPPQSAAAIKPLPPRNPLLTEVLYK